METTLERRSGISPLYAVGAALALAFIFSATATLKFPPPQRRLSIGP